MAAKVAPKVTLDIAMPPKGFKRCKACEQMVNVKNCECSNCGAIMASE